MKDDAAIRHAPGKPGIPPRWTSSDKSGVGTALSALSRVWFTASHGILNETYYPRVDQACIRDFGMLVSDGAGFFSEEKRDAYHEVFRTEDGVPAFRLLNTCIDGRYRIEKQIVTDPDHDVVLQEIRFTALRNEDLKLFALLAPHLVNGGANNTGWTGEYKGQEMLFAEGEGTALALAASVPWSARSVGYAGVSDGWQIVSQHGGLTEQYERAEDGNVALCGELDLSAAADQPIVLALAFGRSWSEAAFRARASLGRGFLAARTRYTAAWRDWQRALRPLDRPPNPRGHNCYRISTSVLRAHDSPSFPGGIIASLSIPWGASKGDDDLGGYHLVWPRDLAETAGALIACGAEEDARRVLNYLRATQEPDGGWPQNCWLDGIPYWHGVQLDECAFPILVVDMARREGLLADTELAAFWPMVRNAAGYLLRNGPITGQDRWEEDAGLSPFTLAVEVTALLAAADLADLHGAGPAVSALLRDTADAWNASVEEWTWAADTELSRELGTAGHYVRIAPPEGVDAPVTIKNVPGDRSTVLARDVVSPDALALVRFGLRAADDPRIRDTVRAIDARLRVELPPGPCWYRYNGDGYGEHEDGSAFDGTGIGRAWPLLTGERAHYELACGNKDEAARLLDTVEALTSRGGLMPEQVWDRAPIPSRELVPGEPSGSAMPLVWAHAEHVKLCRSLADGRVFDMPPQPARRYQHDRAAPRVTIWQPDLKPRALPRGRALRIDLPDESAVVWTADEWAMTHEITTTDTGFGLHAAEIAHPGTGGRIVFTWRRLRDNAWAGENFSVALPDS